MLKLYAEYLGRPLVPIYNRLLPQGKFPGLLITLLLTHYLKLMKNLYYIIIDQFPNWIFPRFLKY